MVKGVEFHCAPFKVQDGDHIFNIGTGTGIWAEQFGYEYPQARVLGIDLVPMQPES
jgi:methylase of polypeptide subunit release factors